MVPMRFQYGTQFVFLILISAFPSIALSFNKARAGSLLPILHPAETKDARKEIVEKHGHHWEEQGREIENTLLMEIFMDYNKEIIPGSPVYVNIDLLLLKVLHTIEKEGTLETVIALLIVKNLDEGFQTIFCSFLFQEWFDPRLSWHPQFHNNITVLAFDSYRIWLPDLAVSQR